jgi:putative FmdB family regulatory protein
VPTYQYACTECGEQLEKVQKFSDDPLTECPACHGRLRKVFSPVGIVFKGSGFYRTDSRSGPVTGGKDSKDGGKDKAESGSKSESSASDKSDKSSAKSGSSDGGSSSSSSSKDSGSSGKSSGSASEKVA